MRPLLRGEREAVTAEQVMRARYSAYATQDEAYLRRSWVAAHRPGRITFEPTLEWTGLLVTGSTAGGMLDQEGTVSFEAGHRRDGRAGVVREVSPASAARTAAGSTSDRSPRSRPTAAQAGE